MDILTKQLLIKKLRRMHEMEYEISEMRREVNQLMKIEHNKDFNRSFFSYAKQILEVDD